MAGKVIWKATVKANCNRDRVRSCAFIESPCVVCDEWTVEEQSSAVFPSLAGLLDAHVLLSEIESLTETLAGHAWRNQPPAGGMSLPITSQCWPWCWWVTWKERSVHEAILI